VREVNTYYFYFLYDVILTHTMLFCDCVYLPNVVIKLMKINKFDAFSSLWSNSEVIDKYLHDRRCTELRMLFNVSSVFFGL